MRRRDERVTKRGNGEGSIYQRTGSDRWEAGLSYLDADGRRRRRTLYGQSRREVAAKLREAQRRYEVGETVADSRDTVGAFLERWLVEALPARGLKATTVENYATITRTHLIPALGDRKLEGLTAADVQRLVNVKHAAGLSPRTVQVIHGVLRRALTQAVRWGEARRNVAALVDRPRVPRREAEYLSPDQAQRLLDAARDDRLFAFYAVAMAAGLRRGEALALRWSDVDLEAGTLRVSRTLSRVVGGGLTFTEPKTERSRRTVPLPAALVAELRAHRVRQAAERLAAGSLWRDHGLVFPSLFGTPLEPRNALRSLQAVAARAGLGHVKLHTLRHTAASLLLAQGVHPRVTMELLGHSGIDVTMNTYSHVMPQQQREAADRMESALRW